jgi:hypothetical protein
MVGELITFPMRVGVRATQLWLRAAEETLGVVADTAGRLIDLAVPRPSATPAAPSATAPEARPVDTRPTPPRTPTRTGPAAAAAAPERIPEPTPAHVSAELELVGEVAEPGAEDGAGAELHIREPWVGYERMNASDVIDRLSGANTAELAAIELYENQNKSRATVLQAVERELRISTGNGSKSERRSQ